MRLTIARFALGLLVTLVGVAPAVAQGTAKKKPATPAKTAEPPAKRAAVKVDLNAALESELEAELPGVTAAVAREIVKARPFKAVDDLKKVKGVTPALYEKIAPRLTVANEAAKKVASKMDAGAGKKAPLPAGKLININKATLEELEQLPGIGPVKAAAIIKARPFASIEDIMKVEGIKEGTFGPIKAHLTVK